MQSFLILYALIIMSIWFPDALAGKRWLGLPLPTDDDVLGFKCGNQLEHNIPAFFPNLLEAMALQLRASGFAVAVSDSGHNSRPDTFALAQCYTNVSSSACNQCYYEARTICFPQNGLEIFLGGCFVRVDNYNFLQEYSRADDKVVCGNGTRISTEFRQVVVKGLTNAIEDNGYRLVRLSASGNSNESAYVLANCWRPLSAQSCSACLKNASASLLSCLPSSEGFALNTGCIMRYAGTDFLNGQRFRQQESGSSTLKKNLHPKKRENILVSVVAVICSVVLVAGAVIGGYMWKRRKLQKKKEAVSDEEKLAVALRDGGLECKYSTLKKATGSFDDANRLGQGAFGTVYKGMLPDGREIAVKRLFITKQHRAADLYNEVKIISSIRHKNLVRLVGCSFSGPESLLVYELLANGSLDHFIFDPSKGKALNWDKRFNIIIGTAEGLVYLHESSETRIVHRDIKAGNILLDAKFHVKIADFGLARSFEQDKSHISTAIGGTLGYMAPEYISHGQLTEKADVYSFGVLLLELVTGRQNNRHKTSEYSDSLVTAMWKHFQQGQVHELFDTNLRLDDNNELNIEHEILRTVHVGLLCTQKMPSLRPSMSTVLQMLSRKNESLPSPTPPPYIDDDELTNGPGDIENKPSGDSASDATISHTAFHPR